MTSIPSSVLLGGLLALGFASAAYAQNSGQGTYGAQNWGGTYNAPSWGQNGGAPWGTQSGNIGQGGWQYNTTPQANQPAGNSAYPNANGRPFGSTPGNQNPLTTRGRQF